LLTYRERKPSPIAQACLVWHYRARFSEILFKPRQSVDYAMIAQSCMQNLDLHCRLAPCPPVRLPGLTAGGCALTGQFWRSACGPFTVGTSPLPACATVTEI